MDSHATPDDVAAGRPDKEASAEDYNAFYSEGGAYGAYDRHYTRSHYYPVKKRVLEEAVRLGARAVLEVGCGSGSFAHMLFDRTTLDYRGFDFSDVAVAKARELTGRPSLFFVADARDPDSYGVAYDTIVCMEVLEHVDADLAVIETWKPGCLCVCTVPNFDTDDHVRLFKTEDEVVARYGGLIDIAGITRVARPLLRGRSFGEYLRQLRWSRDDPKKFLAHLGIRRFDNLAGWFVFSGRRR